MAIGRRKTNCICVTYPFQNRNYSQIEKEVLALVWGIKRFQQYLFGNHFTLVTDHPPLVSILNPEKGLPAVMAARLQRYAIALSECSFDIRYKSTTQHANADALSRLPVVADTQTAQMDKEEGRTFRVHQLQFLPVTVAELRRMTTRDPVLARVLQLILEGWPPKMTEEVMKTYFQRRHELTVEQGCVMWGVRVVIPLKRVLDELHGGHIGVVKMKALARSHVWWPGIDKEIEQAASRCEGCRMNKQSPKRTPLHPWEFSEGPWKRIHLDFAGPIEGKQLLVMVDAYSKWPEVAIMEETTTDHILREIGNTFAK